MLSKLLGSSVVVVGLLLAGPQKASADVVYACVNTTTGLLYIVSATTNCPTPSSGYTWIKINWNATAGGQAPNVSYTPGLVVSDPNIAICTVVNVSAQALTVHTEQFNSQHTLRGEGTTTLQPGNATSVGSGGGGELIYCKFTVTNGTSSDIRVAMEICTLASCSGLMAVVGQ